MRNCDLFHMISVVFLWLSYFCGVHLIDQNLCKISGWSHWLRCCWKFL